MLSLILGIKAVNLLIWMILERQILFHMILIKLYEPRRWEEDSPRSMGNWIQPRWNSTDSLSIVNVQTFSPRWFNIVCHGWGLEVGNHCSKLRTFRYELAWSTVEGFHDLVKNWWEECSPNGCGAFILAQKVAGLRGRLQHWAKFSFGSIKLKKLALLHPLSSVEFQQEKDIRLNLNEICKQEELY